MLMNLLDLNVHGTTVFGRYVFHLLTYSNRRLIVQFLFSMVANLMNASFPNQVPIVPNPALTFNITHGIPSF